MRFSRLDILMLIPTGLSLTGGALFMLTHAMEAHYAWLVGDLIWVAYFRKKNDFWGQVLFSVYMVEILIGIWMWSQ